MSNELFIRFDAGSTSTAHWLRRAAEGGAAASGHGELAEIGKVAAGYRVVVIIPAHQVLLCRATVPGQKRRLLAQAVPYALEDQLAADVDTLHFAFGQISNDTVAVAIIDRALMDVWLQRLREAGISPAALIPETVLLPWQAGEWQLACWDELCLLRHGEQSAIVMDSNNANTLIEAALAEAGETKPHRLVIHAAAEPGFDNLPVETEHHPLPDSILLWLSQHYDERLSLNLMQGAYSRREQIGQYWRPWRAAAALLLVLLVVEVGVTVADYRRLGAEQVALQQQIETTYRQAFPEARKVVNPKVQMERALKELRGGNSSTGLNTLLAEAGREFQASAGLTLQRLSYREGQLDVALTVTDLQQLDELKLRLTQGGKLQVEVQSASAQGSVVEARLKIKGTAS